MWKKIIETTTKTEEVLKQQQKTGDKTLLDCQGFGLTGTFSSNPRGVLRF